MLSTLLKSKPDTDKSATLKPESKEEQLNNVVDAAKQVFDAIIELDVNTTEEEKVEMVNQLENLGEVRRDVERVAKWIAEQL